MAYAKVEETFWHDRKIRGLSEPARYFMLYLITCSHRNRLGCFVLDHFYAGADLMWERVQVEECLRELAEAGRIGYDVENRVVFIRKHIKHNALENPNVVKAAMRDLRGLPDTPLLGLLLTALEEHHKPHYRDLTDAVRARVDSLGDDVPEDLVLPGYSNRSDNPTPNGLGNDGLGKARLGTGKATDEGSTSSSLRSSDGASPDVENSDEGGDAHEAGPPAQHGGDQDRGSQQAADVTPGVSDSEDAGTPEQVGEVYAPLIRKHLWQGSDPPPKAPNGWHMGRDLNVAKRLEEQGFDRDELTGAIALYEGPACTLAAFYKRGNRGGLNELAGRWRKREESRTPHIGEILEQAS